MVVTSTGGAHKRKKKKGREIYSSFPLGAAGGPFGVLSVYLIAGIYIGALMRWVLYGDIPFFLAPDFLWR